MTKKKTTRIPQKYFDIPGMRPDWEKWEKNSDHLTLGGDLKYLEPVYNQLALTKFDFETAKDLIEEKEMTWEKIESVCTEIVRLTYKAGANIKLALDIHKAGGEGSETLYRLGYKTGEIAEKISLTALESFLKEISVREQEDMLTFEVKTLFGYSAMLPSPYSVEQQSIFEEVIMEAALVGFLVGIGTQTQIKNSELEEAAC